MDGEVRYGWRGEDGWRGEGMDGEVRVWMER